MKLLALTCPNCQQWLDAANHDLVVTCRNCRRHVLLGRSGLSLLDVPYAQPKRIEPEKVRDWQPFWVFSGTVNIQRRYTQGGNSDHEAKAMWGQPRRFYVPAWNISSDRLRRWGTSLIQSQPELTPLPAAPETARFNSATIDAGDARKLIEFIVLDIEARRSDMLRDLAFTLTLNEPTLWALPMPEGKIHL